ncbi:MAG: glutamine--fructose-6-phosphate transaminase (isomerizing) [Planctomycetes bacterium]|nr:glutamine--fructose-6-phosphate transaminase (isomerizing) [Planctomycetota bacterium]
MCGIVGYTGNREAQPILLEGLARLEYRGYDSSGLATVNGKLYLKKAVGRIAQLRNLLNGHPLAGNSGICHTRWATHGGVNDANAHPHLGGNGEVAVVHNGVIENYDILKRQLEAQGFQFKSQTDSEVIAHLIASYLENDLVQAVRKALPRLKGTYGLAVVSPRFPGILVGARLGSPLVVGIGDNEMFLASDASALGGFAKRVVYLEDRQICVLTPERWEILDADNATFDPEVHALDWQPADQELGTFAHYMLKEIYEQPEVLGRALAGRLDIGEATAHFGGLNLDAQELRQIDRIIMTACGTSYHAALIGEHLIEQFARIPVEVEYASEFRYRNPPVEKNTIIVGITQSGETADTLAALRESKRKGQRTLGLCNVVGSSIAREVDGGVFLHAGPEIGVASTKAFTAQVAVLTLLAVHLGRTRHLSYQAGARILDELQAMPDILRETLRCHDRVAAIAQKYHQASNMLYLGRQYLFPMALEGALKLKEISYIHAEGYPAAEMKHGPIALVDENTPSVFLIPHGSVYDKVMSNLEEIKARGGPVIAIACADDGLVEAKADDVIHVPNVPEYLQPLVVAIPLQLLAYHIALLRGCDIDKPRNLAKSVTVE